MQGKAHVYKRDHINTDEIIPARYLTMDNEKELAKHAMEDIDPEFVKRVRPGDFIVGGANFGCGSSREHALWALRGTKIEGIIAESFARIFFRNVINNGFLAIECPGISGKVEDGDLIRIDLKSGLIINITKNEKYQFTPVPQFIRDIIEAGGLLNYLEIRLRGRDKKCTKLPF
ncbi:MAG: 3-isopropylmalate dehydratase small subunit [candidate division WOR-3 bacterium]|nr:3-isopropylmalate dehydratase small subunit [candidate division WOR-3 bacterium]